LSDLVSVSGQKFVCRQSRSCFALDFVKIEHQITFLEPVLSGLDDRRRQFLKMPANCRAPFGFDISCVHPAGCLRQECIPSALKPRLELHLNDRVFVVLDCADCFLSATWASVICFVSILTAFWVWIPKDVELVRTRSGR
jgi:hypothetical protein